MKRMMHLVWCALGVIAYQPTTQATECKPEYIKASISGVLNKDTLLSIISKAPKPFQAFTTVEIGQLIQRQNNPNVQYDGKHTVIFKKTVSGKTYEVERLSLVKLAERLNRLEKIIVDYGITLRDTHLLSGGDSNLHIDMSDWYLDIETVASRIISQLQDQAKDTLAHCARDVLLVDGSSTKPAAPQSPQIFYSPNSDYSTAECSVPVIESAFQGQDLGPDTLMQITGRQPITFKPFTSTDVKTAIAKEMQRNPVQQLFAYDDKGTSSLADDVIVFRALQQSTGQMETVSEVNVGQWLEQINRMEQMINEYGFSLRNPDEESLNVWQLYTDPNQFKKQVLAEMKLIATNTMKACIDNIQFDNCPQFSVRDVTEKLKVLPNDRIKMPNGKGMSVSDLVWTVNNGIKLACAVVDMSDSNWLPSGYDINIPDIDLPDVDVSNLTYDYELFRRLHGNALIEIPRIELDQFTLDMALTLDNIVSVQLGLDTGFLHQLYETGRGFMENAESWLSEQLQLDNTAEWFNNVKTQFGVKGRLGDIKAIPVVEEPQYPKLLVKKRKEWPGFNLGDKSLLHTSSRAYMRLYGSDRAQAVVGYGMVDATVLKKTFNVVSAVGEFFIGDLSEASDAIFAAYTKPEEGGAGSEEHGNNSRLDLESDAVKKEGIGILARYELRLLDQVVAEDVAGVDQPLVEWKGRKEFGENWGYESTFMVGPVPVNVGLYANAYAGLGYEAGLKPIKVFGQVGPLAAAGVAASASAGIKGILEVGAKAQMTLIEISAPAQGIAELQFADDGKPYLNLDIRADLAAEVLKGYVEAYAKYPTFNPLPKIKTVRKTLFKWNGKRFTKSIMNWGLTLGYHKTEVRGSMLEQMDVNQANLFQEQITLNERARALESYQASTDNRLDNLTTEISNDLETAPSTDDALAAIENDFSNADTDLDDIADTGCGIGGWPGYSCSCDNQSFAKTLKAANQCNADPRFQERHIILKSSVDTNEVIALTVSEAKEFNENLRLALLAAAKENDAHGIVINRYLAKKSSFFGGFFDKKGNRIFKDYEIKATIRFILSKIQEREYGSYDYASFYNLYMQQKRGKGGIFYKALDAHIDKDKKLGAGILERFEYHRKNGFASIIQFVVDGGDYTQSLGGSELGTLRATTWPTKRDNVPSKRGKYAIIHDFYVYEVQPPREIPPSNFTGIDGYEVITVTPDIIKNVFVSKEARNPQPYTGGSKADYYIRNHAVPPRDYYVLRRVCPTCNHQDHPAFFDTTSKSGYTIGIPDKETRGALLWHWGNSGGWTSGCFVMPEFESELRYKLHNYWQYISGQLIEFEVLKSDDPELYNFAK